jgi:hypothetical protein
MAGFVRCSDDCLRHHASNRDFSRWVEVVFSDHDLATKIREVEASVGNATDANQLRYSRHVLTAVVNGQLRRSQSNVVPDK